MVLENTKNIIFKSGKNILCRLSRLFLHPVKLFYYILQMAEDQNGEIHEQI